MVQLKARVRESQELVNIYCSVNGDRLATSLIFTTNPTIRAQLSAYDVLSTTPKYGGSCHGFVCTSV
ncbi:hypothetical protein J6590_103621 [Homalodisca vitripennis]|nr:hypothetical protein J6590_101452 [Homalodisca vitripennis]KAG8318871.1 hypothetical protein J6590_103621 [Homalodisca vitripennis]